MRIKLAIVSLLLICTISCTQKQVSSIDELKSFVSNEDNGLKKTSIVNGLSCSVIYKPVDLIIAQDLEVNDSQEWAELEANYQGTDFFVLQLSKDGHDIESTLAVDESSLATAKFYFYNEISRDVVLETSGKKIKPEKVTYVESYGVSRTTIILISFESDLKSSNQDFKIVFNERLVSHDIKEFSFDIDDVKNIPALSR